MTRHGDARDDTAMALARARSRALARACEDAVSALAFARDGAGAATARATARANASWMRPSRGVSGGGRATARAAAGKPESDRGTDNPLSSVMFPWERAVLDATRWTGEMKAWQKAYWAAFALGLAFVVGSRVKRYADEKEKEEKRLIDVEGNKRAVQEALEGRSFIGTAESGRDGSSADPFDGLSPEEIEALVRRQAPTGDVYDGMSPEEIEAYEREYEERVRANSGSGNLTWKTGAAAK